MNAAVSPSHADRYLDYHMTGFVAGHVVIVGASLLLGLFVPYCGLFFLLALYAGINGARNIRIILSAYYVGKALEALGWTAPELRRLTNADLQFLIRAGVGQ